MKHKKVKIGSHVTLTVKLDKRQYEHVVPRKGKSFQVDKIKTINGEICISLQGFNSNLVNEPYFPLKYFSVNNIMSYERLLQFMADCET